jgi:hypothetical protein
MLGRRGYILLVCAVILSSLLTLVLRPPKTEITACGVDKTTLAVEVCPPGEVKTILDRLGPDGRDRLYRQTVADFALIASYAGLWGATGLALHPIVAVMAVAAAGADVIEDLAIFRAFEHPRWLPVIRCAGLTKWALLGLAFVALVLLFRPCRRSGWLTFLVLAATALAYGLAGLAFVAGLVDPRFVGWGTVPMVVAVFLQLVVHLAFHDDFVAHAQRWRAGHREASTSLSLEQVLREEFERLHPPLNAGTTGLGALYEAIHGLVEKRAALCISGGGIRSATFALGVMQGLARVGVLPHFHYLSTVSGGGYIGGWLTAWLHHQNNDVAAVSASLARVDPTRKLEPEPAPITHLREYSNYLAPRSGLLSADTWTLIGTVLRNLILLWFVLVPLLVALLMLPRIYLSLLRAGQVSEPASDRVGCVLLAVGAIALAWAVAYIGASIPSSTTALRGQGLFLSLCLAPLMVAVLCLTLFWAWWPTRTAMDFVRFAVAVHMAAWLGYTSWLWIDWRLTPGRARKSARQQLWAVVAALFELLVVVVVGVAAGYLAWLLATVLFPDLESFTLFYASVAPAVFIGAFLLAATLLVGLLSRLTQDEDREWWARAGAWMLIAGTVWLVLNSLVLFGPLLFSGPVVTWLLASVGGVSGLFTIIGGWSARSAATTTTSDRGRASILDRLVLPAAAALFAVVLLIALSTLTTGLLGWLLDRRTDLLPGDHWEQWPPFGEGPLDHVAVLLTSSPLLVAAAGVGLALVGAIAAWCINTNKFSLHAMYRARLIRAYLGASNDRLDRNRNPFTGFDETDNIQMHELWPSPQSAPRLPGAPPRTRLFHVVNLALNLVHGDRLAWQERKAHSFTVSPLHAGSVAADVVRRVSADDVRGYRRTGLRLTDPRYHYGGPRGISLGTAITISGAAASPNMGYHSSPVVTFLMTFFNARLGWWLGNPGPAGENTFHLSFPRFTVRPIVAEAFGLTGRTSPYVYLSDGGHFENLGLYEMVLRRCHFIVVSDASCDETCELTDLGGAIRKIRIDLGIPIEFPRGISIYPRSADPATRARGVYWAVGRIRYSTIDPPAPPATPAACDARDGWLLYVKPAFYGKDGKEPSDVYQYALANQPFPHESTVDQFFSESQFESYRMLGWHAVTRLCEGWTGHTLAELMTHADRPRPYEG